MNLADIFRKTRKELRALRRKLPDLPAPYEMSWEPIEDGGDGPTSAAKEWTEETEDTIADLERTAEVIQAWLAS